MNYEDRKVVAITTSKLGKDANGFQQYIWATEDELNRLLDAQFDEERRSFVYRIGDYSIRPCDIICFKFVRIKEAKEWPSFRNYVVAKLGKEDETKKIEGAEVNEEGIRKLEELKGRCGLLK